MAYAPNANCRGPFIGDEVFTVSCNCLSIICILTIGFVSYDHFSKKERMHLTLEILFYSAVLSGCAVSIGSALYIISCPVYGYRTALGLSLLWTSLGHLGSLATTLAIFVIRLYCTFEQTQWAIPLWKFNFSLFCLCLMVAVMVIALSLKWVNIIGWYTFYGLFSVCFAICLSVTFWAVFNFVMNLLSLAKQRASSMATVAAEVNQKQLGLINLSSKYITLFLVSTVSVVLDYGLSYICLLVVEVNPGFLWGIDGVIQIVCLYLYYNFAERHYEKYCHWMDVHCRSMMTRTVRMNSLSMLTAAISNSEMDGTSPKARGDDTVFEKSMSASPSPVDSNVASSPSASPTTPPGTP